MDIPVAFRTWQTPAQNSAAWATAVNAIPPNGARLILPDGEFHHQGLSMVEKVNTTIVGGGGDPAKSHRTRLFCDRPGLHALHISQARNVHVTGFFSGHTQPSHPGIAAIAVTDFFEVTIDRVSTWEGDLWGTVSKSRNGLLLRAIAAMSGGAKITNCTFMQHPEHGIYLLGTSDAADIQETSIFDNVLMDNPGIAMYYGDYTAGTYVSRNSLWGNGLGIKCESTTAGACHDVFLTANIVDMSTYQNFLAINVDSGHLKSNWFSWAGWEGEDVYNIEVIGMNTAYPPPWEISDNTILSPVGGGIHFAMFEGRIHNNTIKGQAVNRPGVRLAETTADVSVMANWIKGHSPAIQNLSAANFTDGNALF